MDKALHTYIVFQLGQRRISQYAIAVAAGVTPSLVNQVIMGRKRSERVQETVARALGCSSWLEVLVASARFQEAVLSSSKKEA